MLEVIDYGGGNTGSLSRALGRLGVPFRMVGEGTELDGSEGVILPGVGSFGAVMRGLNSGNLAAPLRRVIAGGTAYLGICVGLQVLFEGSEEAPGVAGLGILPGKVVRLEADKVPQIGWNYVEARREPAYGEGWAYFVNSYAARPSRSEDVLYESEYGGAFCAGVSRGRVVALQFHPEKSGPFGHGILRRWIDAL
ncbi:MAG: imidazole glycerol phosphate synthase subunit HisH [Planctomycetota bacterium]|jgi:imidazole glycerol phosphate synthase glutamine amidotransferase subunit